MKHERFITTVGLIIFLLCTLFIAVGLVMIFSNAYEHGGYTFDISIIAFLLNAYGVTMIVVALAIVHGILDEIGVFGRLDGVNV